MLELSISIRKAISTLIIMFPGFFITVYKSFIHCYSKYVTLNNSSTLWLLTLDCIVCKQTHSVIDFLVSDNIIYSIK